MTQVDVEVLYKGEPIEDGCYTQLDPYGGVNMVKKKVDNYKRILGDGNARVTVLLGEKQGGPGYSSISVNIEISVQCTQSEEAINEASDILVTNGMEILDNHINNAYSILLAHRNELDEKLQDSGWDD